MTKQLVEEIMQLEVDAEKQLAQAAAEHDAIIKKAHEKAHLLIQEAERTLDTEREALIRQHDSKLHEQKQQMIAAARAEAKELAKRIERNVPKAAEQMLKRFKEYASNDVS